MSGVAIVSVKQAFREIKSYDLDGWENIYSIYRGSNLYT